MSPPVSSAGLPLKTDLVLPVHNRRETTLRCLANLRALGAFSWIGVIVVDDGSTDGTGQAVRDRYPEVTLLTGDGNLWWGGAVLKGMRHAFDREADLIFWQNDDCFPRPGTLERLAHHAAKGPGAAIGQAFTPLGVRYGAYLRTPLGLRPILARAGEVLPCDAFGGNCVCFSRPLVEQIGLLDARHFPHCYGDHDYGLRLREHGRRAEVLGDAVCDNDDNHTLVGKSWLLSDVSPVKILASFFCPKSNLYVPAFFYYKRRHWGAPGLVLFVLPYLKFFVYAAVRLVVPQRWLRAWVGSRSRTWRRESLKNA